MLDYDEVNGDAVCREREVEREREEETTRLPQLEIAKNWLDNKCLARKESFSWRYFFFFMSKYFCSGSLLQLSS